MRCPGTHTFFSIVRDFFLIIPFSTIIANSAVAANLTLAWDANTDPVGGYKLYRGSSSGNYSSSVDVGKKTTHTVTGLKDGKAYYFAVTAYDSTRTSESDYSTEISATVSPAASAPVASFNATPTSGEAPLIVTFKDTSSGNITSRVWDFGDGSTSTAQTAIYTYQTPGTYKVSLKVTGPRGTDTETKTDHIVVTSSAPVADFSASSTKGTAPLAVSFSDASRGDVTTWSWKFGDGRTSTARNPKHTYKSAGTYNVTLTVTGSGGTDSETKSGYIKVSANTDGSSGSNGVYQQGSGFQGLLAMEAENYESRVAQGGHDWVETKSPKGFSGNVAMQATPNKGTNNNKGYLSNSPRLDFPVNFVKTGIHYVWLRGQSNNGGDNSAHVGLNGQANNSADRINFTTGQNWVWTNNTMDATRATLNVTTPGEYMLNVWMREDGIRLDKIVVTTDPDFSPGGKGPNESPVSGSSPSGGTVGDDGSSGTGGGAASCAELDGWTNKTIRTDTLLGSVTCDGGVLTVEGSGRDIWSYSDGFEFFYKEQNSNVEIVTKVYSLVETNAWAKAGVMIRDSLNPRSAHALVALTGSKGVAFQYRAATNGNSKSLRSVFDDVDFRWVRLVRNGDLFIAYESVDGKNWNEMGRQMIAMSGSMYVGLAVTSHDNSVRTTAKFSNIGP